VLASFQGFSAEYAFISGWQQAQAGDAEAKGRKVIPEYDPALFDLLLSTVGQVPSSQDGQRAQA
jgi:hypothetical protein